jgi:hypothetical protein
VQEILAADRAQFAGIRGSAAIASARGRNRHALRGAVRVRQAKYAQLAAGRCQAGTDDEEQSLLYDNDAQAARSTSFDDVSL